MKIITKFFSLLGLLILSNAVSAQSIYSSYNGSVIFYSYAPFENINAVSENGVSVINVNKNEVIFEMQIRSFVFDMALMQEHFNEIYMESNRFPKAQFRGSFDEPLNLSIDGEFGFSVTGKLEIKGVSRVRTIPGSITIKDGKITRIQSAFTVNCKMHNIKIPKIYSTKISENIEIVIDASYVLYAN